MAQVLLLGAALVVASVAESLGAHRGGENSLTVARKEIGIGPLELLAQTRQEVHALLVYRSLLRCLADFMRMKR